MWVKEDHQHQNSEVQVKKFSGGGGYSSAAQANA